MAKRSLLSERPLYIEDYNFAIVYGGVDLYRSCCIQLHYLHFGVMWNSVLTARFSLTGRSSAAKQYRSSFGFFHTAFFLGFVVGCGKLGKVVEIDEGVS